MVLLDDPVPNKARLAALTPYILAPSVLLEIIALVAVLALALIVFHSVAVLAPMVLDEVVSLVVLHAALNFALSVLSEIPALVSVVALALQRLGAQLNTQCGPLLVVFVPASLPLCCRSTAPLLPTEPIWLRLPPSLTLLPWSCLKSSCWSCITPLFWFP